jgi:virginiamycin B lyase
MSRIGLVTTAGLAALLLAAVTRAATPHPSSTPQPLASSVAGRFTEYSIPSPGVAEGIALGPDGALWFSERYTTQIGRMTRGGAFTIFSFRATRNLSADITSGPDGALWFTFPNSAPPMNSGKIGRITTGGDATFYRVPWTGDPESITPGPDGSLWFTDHVAAAVGRITTDGLFTKFRIPGPTGAYPYEIAAGPDGALWFTDFNGRRIGRLTTEGIVSFYALRPGAGLPDAITAGPDGNLWFTLDATGRIGRITTSGTITEFRIDHPKGHYVFLSGIAAGADGALWFTYQDYTSGVSRVGRITTSGEASTFPTPTSNSSPHGITAGRAGAMWFTEAAAGNIGRIDPD